MENFTIRIAGKVFAVSALYKSTRIFCKDYLCYDSPDISVEITYNDIAFEQETTEREYALEGLPIRKMPDSLLECTAMQRKIAECLFEYDTLLLHGSAIAVDGEAYLFTAKSGTGKSTHTRLWRELLGKRAIMINDDKPFLQITESGIRVFGSPWNGKHHLGSNVNLPLKAICILSRGVQNKIVQVSANDAVQMLLQQSNRPIKHVLLPKYLENLGTLAEMCKFYSLECNMDPEAALISYQAMSGDVKGN